MKIDLQNNNLILSFPYDQKTINFIKQIDGRRYDPKFRTWKVPASVENYEQIFKNYSMTAECSPKILSWYNDSLNIQKQIQHAQKFKTETLPTDYTFKTKPFAHQVQCFNFFRELNRGGLLISMGLGKTKIIVDILSYLKLMGKIINPILYVCPNSVLENVKHEFELHSSIEWDMCILNGPKGKKIRLLTEAKHDIYIINYEAVRTVEQELMKKGFDVIICDESTRIKNPQALCSKVLHRLGQTAKYRYIMTGTPLTENVIDIFSQYKFLEPSLFGPSFYSFKNRYAVMGGYMNHQIVKYRHLDELHKKIFSVALRFTKEQCLDLPEKIYEVKKFDLNQQEQDLYKQIKKNIFTEIMGKQISAQLAITKLTKLLQVTSGFVLTDDNKRVGIKNSSKLKLLKETIDDILPNKIIIWNIYTANVDMISKMLTEMKIGHVIFDGRVKQEDRQGNVDEFQTNPDCKVFVGQIKSGGMGINLTAASYVVYYSNTYSLADRLQSEDRAHRIGSVRNVTYIDLIARGTIEKSIIKALKKKLNLAKLIIDNNDLEKLVNGEL